MKYPNLVREKKAWRKGYTHVAGVDEVGRGALAGPVVVAAVIFDHNHCPIEAVADSKLLREETREKLYPLITQQAMAWKVATVSVGVIDRINILQATLLAMKRAVNALPVAADYVLVDGNQFPAVSAAGAAVVDGDHECYSIAAASIVAKVWRDRWMRHAAQTYPAYLWEKNKGYGTLEHRAAIKRYGTTPYHRALFVHQK